MHHYLPLPPKSTKLENKFKLMYNMSIVNAHYLLSILLVYHQKWNRFTKCKMSAFSSSIVNVTTFLRKRLVEYYSHRIVCSVLCLLCKQAAYTVYKCKRAASTAYVSLRMLCKLSLLWTMWLFCGLCSCDYLQLLVAVSMCIQTHECIPSHFMWQVRAGNIHISIFQE